MKATIYFIVFVMSLVVLSNKTYSQVVISDNGSTTPDPSAVLDLQSNSLGFLAPQLTALEISNITDPAHGLLVYQLDGTPGYYYNTGTTVSPVWNRITDDTTPIGYWTQTGSDIFYTTGNVGIGSASPAVPLDVVGDAHITGALQLSNAPTDGHVLTSDASGNATWQAPAGADSDWAISGNDIYSQNTGNVGIGSATPLVKLDVVGGAHITGALQFDNGASAGHVLTSDASGNATWQAAPGGNDGDWTISGTDILSAVSGNVGIGSATPAAKLDVDGSAKITGALLLTNGVVSGTTDGYVLTVDASGNATWEDVNDNIINDADWVVSGTTMYSNAAITGNVGIGITTPGAKLDVNGAGHFVDSLYVSGRPGKLFINGETSYDPTIRFGYEGSSLFKQYIKDPATNPYLTLTAAPYDDIWGLQQTGRVWHNPKSTTDNVSGYVISTSSPARAISITQSNGTDLARGIQVTMSNTGNSTAVIGIGAWSDGDATGLYGQNKTSGNYGHVGTINQAVYGQHGTTENRGSIGTPTYGVFGRTGEETDYHWGAIGIDGITTDWGIYGAQGTTTDPNFGGIGTEDYGVYGEYNSENFFGVLGADNAGVYGYLGGSGQDLDDGDFAVIGRGVENSTESGTDYAYGSSIGGVMGFNTQGVAYSYGVAGYTETSNDRRSGGVIGSLMDGSEWGALAYHAQNNTTFGGYFTTTTTGSGKSQTTSSSGIGLGVYGDLFGAHIDGNIYGLYAEGENYGIYAHGDMYRTGADIHLQENNSGENTVMFTQVSTEMTIQTYGFGQLQAGKSSITFDRSFSDVVSTDEPILVSITPIGNSGGVYLENVDGNGFSVAENNSGRSNVQFSYIAIGKRKGYENVNLPADVVASDYNTKIQRGLSNDADANAQGEGLYYQNGMLHNGQVQSSRSSAGIAIAPAKNLEHIVVDDASDAALKSPAIKKAEEAGIDKK